MVEVSKPPRDEASDDAPSGQHPLGLFYFDEGRSQTVVEVTGGTEQDPKFYVLGQDRRYNLSDFPAKCRMLGPVVMPARRHEEVIKNPTQLAAEMIQSAYQSGFAAGATGLKPELQAVVKYHLHDGLVHALMTAVASGARLRTRREEDVYEVVDRLVENAERLGAFSGTRGSMSLEAQQLRDAAMYQIRDVVDKPNPNHPDAAKRTYGAEDHEVWVGENERLRSVILFAASKIPDKAVLREIGAKIREASVQDKAEEDEIQVLDFRKLVETVCDLVDSAVDCHIPEMDLSSGDVGRGRYLPLYWRGKAENAASKLRQACCDLPEVTTLARLRFA